jgi:TPR repeat protein
LATYPLCVLLRHQRFFRREESEGPEVRRRDLHVQETGTSRASNSHTLIDKVSNWFAVGKVVEFSQSPRYTRAVDLGRKATEANNPKGMLLLALMYENGRGLPRDLVALESYIKSPLISAILSRRSNSSHSTKVRKPSDKSNATLLLLQGHR